jgi:hypothetical protein
MNIVKLFGGGVLNKPKVCVKKEEEDWNHEINKHGKERAGMPALHINTAVF